jgi:hypothetical protein
MTASGAVTVWFTQRREGAKEGKKTISFSSSLRLCVIKLAAAEGAATIS